MPRFPAVFAFTTALLGGCAADSTLVSGSLEQLRVESEPAGAAVRLSTGATGTTPVRFSVPRKAEIGIVIRKEGYEPVELHLQPVMRGWAKAGMALDAVNPALLPISVAATAASSASYTHRPNPVRVKLKPIGPTGAESAVGKSSPPSPGTGR